MPSYSQGLTIIQSGREATKGTAVAATSKFAVEGFTTRPIDAIIRPKIIKGLLLANPGDELAVHRGMEWEIANSPVIYNQFQQFLAMVYKGAVSPAGAGPYTWTYTRDPTADPTLDSRTFEVRQTDGATPNDIEFAYGMCQSLEISGAENEALRFAARGFGRRPVGDGEDEGGGSGTARGRDPRGGGDGLAQAAGAVQAHAGQRLPRRPPGRPAGDPHGARRVDRQHELRGRRADQWRSDARVDGTKAVSVPLRRAPAGTAAGGTATQRPPGAGGGHGDDALWR